MNYNIGNGSKLPVYFYIRWNFEMSVFEIAESTVFFPKKKKKRTKINSVVLGESTL